MQTRPGLRARGDCSHELQDPAGSLGPESNYFDLRENENFLKPSTAVLVRLMSQIFALTPLFKNGSIKY